jgi:hypothetical protein
VRPATLALAMSLGCAHRELPDPAMLLRPYPSGTAYLLESDGSEREQASDARFEQAMRAYEAGRFAEAARDFLLAAEPIRRPRAAPNGELMLENRRTLYRDAQRAFCHAHAVAELRARLTEAATLDGELAAELRALADAGCAQ